MRFFVPHAGGRLESERALAAFRAHLATLAYPTTDRRIRRLAFRHEKALLDLHIGACLAAAELEPAPAGTPGPHLPPALVMAILEGATLPVYFVCTPGRGGCRGYPWIVARASVRAVEEFGL